MEKTDEKTIYASAIKPDGTTECLDISMRDITIPNIKETLLKLNENTSIILTQFVEEFQKDKEIASKKRKIDDQSS